MTTKKALVTGITRQDGSYLAAPLLAKDCKAHGMVRRGRSFSPGRMDHLHMKNRELMERRRFRRLGDFSDPISVAAMVEAIQPDEIGNRAAREARRPAGGETS